MTINFEQYAQKGNQFLNELTDELGTDDKTQAARIMRAVFRTLRDVITIHESIQLLSQLPMALKSVYVDGWDINIRKKFKTENDFLSNVAREEGRPAWKDFASVEDIRESAVAVFKIMGNYVSEGEIKDLESVLPKAIKPLVNQMLKK